MQYYIFLSVLAYSVTKQDGAEKVAGLFCEGIKGMDQRGKCFMGCFSGFKLHLFVVRKGNFSTS